MFKYLRILIVRKYFFKKYFNLIKAILLRKFKFLKLDYLPYVADVEPTTGCNFKCTMCQVSSPNFKAKNMTFEIFRKFIDENKQLFKIKLQGMGEPTIHKQFFEMIKYANQNGISVEFTTNGSLISDEKINQLYKLNISQINISIDGYTKKTFEKIRVNSNFEKVIENSRNLINKMKSKLLAPKIIAWTVVQNDNFEEILDIYKLCNKLGFDEIVFQFHISDWGKKEWLVINSKKDKRNEILSIQKKLELLKKREKFKFKIFKENILNFKKQCSWPWHSLYLDSKGFVTPCCIIGDSNVKNFGNIQEKKFIEIYNSNEYAEFRNQIKNNKIPEFCKNCYSEFRKN